MNRKKLKTKDYILIGSIFITLMIGLFINIQIVSQLFTWGIGYGTYHIVQTYN